MQIIFITGYSDYIAEGYEVEALHYLMKPLNQDKLFQVLDRAVLKCRQTEHFLRVGRAMIVNLNQVRRVTRKEIILSDGAALPLPRGAYESLNRAIITRT